MKLENISYPETYLCKLTVSASAEEFEAAIQANYESKRETLKVKGFERGEATRAQAEQIRGQDFFWFDAANAILDAECPAIYKAAVAEHSLNVISECSYDIERVSKEDGFAVSMSFSLLPEFVFGDYKSIVVTQKSAKVTDEEVERVIAAQKDLKPELVDEFRVKVREKLEENRKASVKAEAENMVMMKLAEYAEGEIPTPVIEEAYESMLKQLNDFLQQQNVTMQDFLDKTGHTKEQLSADTRKGAEARVRSALALLRLGTNLGYAPTPEEVEAEVMLRAEQVKSKVKDFAEKADRRRVAMSMIRKKATMHVLENATIVNADEA